MTVWRSIARFFGNASFALAVIAMSLNFGVAQTRDYDFDQNGKPVQVSGPGYGTQAAAAAQPPAGQQGQTGAGNQNQASAPGTTPTPSSNKKIVGGYTGVYIVLGALVLLGLVALLIWKPWRRKNEDEEETEQPEDGQPEPASEPVRSYPRSEPRPHRASPPAPPAEMPSELQPHADPEGHKSTATEPTAPPTPVPPDVHNPGTDPGSGHVSDTTVRMGRKGSGTTLAPLIGVLVALFAAQAVHAQQYSVFPSAIPVGKSVDALVAGHDAGEIIGCTVALPDTGCGFSHVISPSQVVIRFTAGPNALGGRAEPIRGALRLVFSSGRTVTMPNKVAVGTPEQVGVAMLAPHATPPMHVQPTNDTAARNQAAQALAAARSANARIARLESRYSGVSRPAPASAPALQTEEQRIRTIIRVLREEGVMPQAPASQSVAPAVVPQFQAPATQFQSAPVTSSGPQALSAATGQAIINRLDRMAQQRAEDRARMNELAAGLGEVKQAVQQTRTDFVTANKAVVDGLGVVAGTSLRGLPHKKDRCQELRRYEEGGIRITDDVRKRLGCK